MSYANVAKCIDHTMMMQYMVRVDEVAIELQDVKK